MRAMAYQITGVSIVYSNVCSCADQRKHQSSASLAFVRRIHQWPVNSPHKGPVTRKTFPLMTTSWMLHPTIMRFVLGASLIREVLLHVKRERVRVTSDSGAQIRYTSRSRTLLGFATRRDLSADKQAHRYQQMTRQQSIKHIRKQKWTYTV